MLEMIGFVTRLFVYVIVIFCIGGCYLYIEQNHTNYNQRKKSTVKLFFIIFTMFVGTITFLEMSRSKYMGDAELRCGMDDTGCKGDYERVWADI